MNRPRIAIAWPREDYLAAIDRAGAVAVRLDPARDSVPEALSACDGLLLTGGADVDPAAYGERERHPTVELAPERDAYELQLAKVALERQLPLLAICRGVQVLNVAAGGTLIQDIPSQHPTPLAHSIREPRNAIAHDVIVQPGTRLAQLLDTGPQPRSVAVNSRHHQAIKRPAEGFVVSAAAPDGIIEAVEHHDAPFCVGVQWHPENFWRTGEFAALFTGLVDAARARTVSST